MNSKLLLAALIVSANIAVSVRAESDCTSINACDPVCACKATSHTFFSVRPVYTVNSPEYLAHNRDFYKEYHNGWGGTLQATILGGRSNHDKSLARFFLPFCRTTLTVSEQPLATTDVLASQLNIYTRNGTFESTVEFKPEHDFIGLGINYQQRFYESCTGNAFWFSLSGPLLHVRNRVLLDENIINDGGGALLTPAVTSVVPSCPLTCPNSCNTDCTVDPSQVLQPVGSVVQAFAQPGWCYGRIDNNCHKCESKTKIGDVTFRIGYEAVNRPECHLDTFAGFIAPTGNTPTAQYLFEPMVGHNHHWGFILGSTFGLDVWCGCNGDLIIATEFDFSISDFFAHNERRSFDLKYKPWSRYMQFYKNVEQAQLAAASQTTDPTFALLLHTPGIDILTQEVRVKPGFYRTFNGAYIINYCALEVEAGYNFFARQGECMHLACPFEVTAALKALSVGGGATAPYATINNDFSSSCTATPVANYAQNIITEHDIDLESAAHPSTITHTVYGSLGYNFSTCTGNPAFVALGGSYEFPPDNIGMNRWMAWAKAGIAF